MIGRLQLELGEEEELRRGNAVDEYSKPCQASLYNRQPQEPQLGLGISCARTPDSEPGDDDLSDCELHPQALLSLAGLIGFQVFAGCGFCLALSHWPGGAVRSWAAW
jgi:hypothetical protein